MVEEKLHIPVMLHEVIDYLLLKPGQLIVDATLGTGGHAVEILKRITPHGRLIGLDRDAESINVCRKRLSDFSNNCEFVQANFVDLDQVLARLGIDKIDGIIFDLGISTFQLKDAQRG